MRCSDAYSLYKINTFITASRIRNAAEMDDPIMEPTSEEAPKRPNIATELAATTIEITTTTVEWLREKTIPTVTGRWPEASRRLTLRSMAVVWSASNACRMSRV